MNTFNSYILFSWLLVATACQPKTEIQSNNNIISTEEANVAHGLIQGAFDDLWGGLDSTKILDYHTEDFIILEQGEVWDNQMIKNYIKKSLLKENRPVRINRMEFIRTDKVGDVINMAYRNYATFMMGDSIVGNVQWLESATAVNQPSGWRLKMMHSTWVPNEQ